MTLDEELLKKAREAGAGFAEAERQALLARADYHTAVRRLHLAGGSFREMAQVLSLSHQRIQQIVEGAGGSWWSRMWRTRTVKSDAVCTFCGRPPREVEKLISGPDVYICDACVALAEKALRGAGRASTPLLPVKEGAWVRCSFCGKRRGAQRPMIAGGAARVCADCLRLCREILNDRVA